MLAELLDVVVALFVIRAIWKLLQGLMEGLSGRPQSTVTRPSPPSDPPALGVQMARDRVCGTYVVPERALSITDGRKSVYFCSATCRDKYRAKTA